MTEARKDAGLNTADGDDGTAVEAKEPFKLCNLSLSHLTKAILSVERPKVELNRLLTLWVNTKIAVSGLVVNDLFADLTNGAILQALLEVLSGKSMAPYGKLSKGSLRIQLIANINLIFKFLAEEEKMRFKVVGMTATHIVGGNRKMILDLLWEIMDFYVQKTLNGSKDGKKLRKQVVSWVNAIFDCSDVNVTPMPNLGSFLADGKFLMALLAEIDPEAFPFNPTGDGKADLEKALTLVEEQLGLKHFLDLDEEDESQERLIAAYIADLVRSLRLKFPNNTMLTQLDDIRPTTVEESKVEELPPLTDVHAMQVRIKELELKNESLEKSLAAATSEEDGTQPPRQPSPVPPPDRPSVQRRQSMSLDLAMQKRVDELQEQIIEMEKHHAQEEEAFEGKLAGKDSEIERLNKKIRDQDTERRKLHNLVQELRGNVRVFARIRPFLPNEEVDPSAEPLMTVDIDLTTLNINAPGRGGERELKPFTYDHAFDQTATQDEVFLEVSEFVQSALDGYNVCLFSYGQTGSGKTHTMQGAPSGEQRGIIPRAIEQVAQYKQQLEANGWTFEMQVSFVEIYCEQIKDLLADPSVDHKPSDYKITKNEFGQHFVAGAEMVPVEPSDKDSIDDLMQHAAAQRSVTATKMNAQSSRSHSIFTLHLKAFQIKQKVTIHGQLNLVDLAGSERVEKSGVTGKALTEAKNINTSLSALAGVFHSLGQKNSHVPYRDSKLTELLMPALSGNGKTLMMLNLSPVDSSATESLSSLRFGATVNQCELGRAKRVIKKSEKEKAPSTPTAARGRSPARVKSATPPSRSTSTSKKRTSTGSTTSRARSRSPGAGSTRSSMESRGRSRSPGASTRSSIERARSPGRRAS